MGFQEKIDSLCDKYGVKYFAYSRQDLHIFTTDELERLVAGGLVQDEELHYRLMHT